MPIKPTYKEKHHYHSPHYFAGRSCPSPPSSSLRAPVTLLVNAAILQTAPAINHNSPAALNGLARCR